MLELLKKIYSKFVKAENDRFVLLKKALPKEVDLNQIREIKFLTAMKYREGILDDLKLVIKKNEIINFVKKNEFNSLNDALELYLFQKKDYTYSIYILFSPVEFYENEYIVDIIDFPFEIESYKFKESTIIFKSNP